MGVIKTHRRVPYGGHPEFGPRVVANDGMPSIAGWEALAKDALIAWDEECSFGQGVLDLLERMRTYARHAPFCEYSPTYPDTPATTCTCGFDAVLREYGIE